MVSVSGRIHSRRVHCTWQKVDGRHVHWVKPHQPESSVRYPIVLFRNIGGAAELFYHSDAVAPEPPRRPLRVGHDCAGKNAPCQALRSLRVDFTEAFASDLDEFACQTIEANFHPVKF